MAEESISGRKLRTKERKVYTDELDDEEIEGNRRTFDLDEKLKSNRFAHKKFVMEMAGEDLTVKYFQENGFKLPILVRDKNGLGMRVPGENFTVNDVKQCVGSRRVIDVMDVNTQKGDEMTMKEWTKYYENKERDRLLNVISLEFSHTRLENYVEQPTVVRQLDWVDTVWPQYFKDCQTESTNVIEKMKYPKVQKYCLMSVKGCYTDFHIDMGGTSVWYHILHGKKVFWLIPPTEENLDLFEKWVKSGRQGDIFFGDKVKDCVRINLEKSFTFFIPTGWIHAVFTPEDSVVFGGNFLHSINMELQLKVWEIESKTHVPSKFRYPFFTELHWYLLDQYISCVQGRSQRVKSAEEMKLEREEDEEEEKAKIKAETETLADVKTEDYDMGGTPPRSPLDDDRSSVSNKSLNGDNFTSPQSPGSRSFRGPKSSGRHKQEQSALTRPVSVKLENCMLKDKAKSTFISSSAEKKSWVNLTEFELKGLRIVMHWLENLPPTKKMVPKDLPNSDDLISDIKKLLEEHLGDSSLDAVTGESILKWPVKKKAKVKVRTYSSFFQRAKHPKGANKSSSSRRRRVRCKKCEPCTRSDCMLCNFCKDMKKYGGPGRMKQSCISRQCLRPELPNCAVCIICNKAELEGDQKTATADDSMLDCLMECGICWEIAHPECHSKKHPNVTTEGIVNEDLPNSWECTKCVDEGKHGQIKPRPVKGAASKRPEYSKLTPGGPASTSPTPSLGDSDAENKQVLTATPLVPTITPARVGRPPKERRASTQSSLVKEVVSPTVDCNGFEPQKREKRRHSSLSGIDLGSISPPKKILRVELSPLRGYPVSVNVTSLPRLQHRLNFSSGTSVKDESRRTTKREPSPLKSPQSTSRRDASSLKSPKTPKRDPSPTKSPFLSPKGMRSPSPKKSPLPTTRITTRGREINLPSRFLR